MSDIDGPLLRIAQASERIAAALEKMAGTSGSPPRNGVIWHDAHTFDCALKGQCSSTATTLAGDVGPWSQLVDHGWRRDRDGQWCCPQHHDVESVDPTTLLARKAASNSGRYHAIRTPIRHGIKTNACMAPGASAETIPAADVPAEQRCQHTACQYVFRLVDDRAAPQKID